MSFDALLKKYFLAVVVAMLAIAAYFQAAGATALLGAAFLPTLEQLSVLPKPAEIGSGPGKVQKSGDAILARNVFDSVTGPLSRTERLDDTTLPTQADFSNPLQAPPCDNVRLAIVTESTDPMWSLAALQGPGEPKPTIRRVGESVGSSRIAYIGFNSYHGSPSVWMVDGARLCQSTLFAKQGAPQAAAPAAASAAPPKTTTPAPGSGAPALPADMAAKIQKISPTEYNVDRSVVDKILENQATLMRSARIVPEQQDGKVVGVRLFGIRPDTLLGHLGFQNGDRLEAVNGFNMSSPDKALEAYARLRTASNLSVKITRRGQPATIDLHIK